MIDPIKRGGIYMVHLKPARGSEQTGIRPFLVLQNNKGNDNSFTHSGLPLSSELKSLYLPTHIVTEDTKCLDYTSVVLVEQITTLSRSRFQSYLGILDANTLNKVEASVAIQLGLKDVRDIDKVIFLKRLTELNPVLRVHICGSCLRVLHGVKGLSIRGIHQGKDELDFCILCHKAKGRIFKVVNRERLGKRHEEKSSERIRRKARKGK